MPLVVFGMAKIQWTRVFTIYLFALSGIYIGESMLLVVFGIDPVDSGVHSLPVCVFRYLYQGERAVGGVWDGQDSVDSGVHNLTVCPLRYLCRGEHAAGGVWDGQDSADSGVHDSPVCPHRYLYWGERAAGGVWDGQDSAGADAGGAERTEAGGRAAEGACHGHLQEESERCVHQHCFYSSVLSLFPLKQGSVMCWGGCVECLYEWLGLPSSHRSRLGAN